MENKFKPGQILKLKSECELLTKGWNHNMQILIKKYSTDYNPDGIYTYIHFNDGSKDWKKGTKSAWVKAIVEENFELDKTITILYGNSQ